jgi:hypothetical protein
MSKVALTKFNHSQFEISIAFFGFLAVALACFWVLVDIW